METAAPDRDAPVTEPVRRPGFLHEDILRVPVRGQDKLELELGISHVPGEGQLDPAQLESILVAVIGTFVGRQMVAGAQVRNVAGLDLPAEVEAETAVGGLDEELAVVAGGGAVGGEAGAGVGVGQGVAD